MSLMQRALEKAEREGRLPSWEVGVRPTAGLNVLTKDPEPRISAGASALPVWAPETPPEPFSPLLVAATAPDSPAAEQFRMLRSRLEERCRGRRSQLMLVTSPRIGDGKTTTSANLAVTMAQDVHQRVVLLEADLRRPRLAALFGVRAEPGLIDVLTGGATIDQALVPIPGQHLALLPAGLPSARSAEILSGATLQQAVDDLRARFTRIIVDTPPLGLADTHELARVADGVLLVARAGVTPRPSLDRALASLEEEKVMGFVLNEVDEVTDYYTRPDGERPTSDA
jgi:capsular exopolysaccharide synthesis family protein